MSNAFNWLDRWQRKEIGDKAGDNADRAIQQRQYANERLYRIEQLLERLTNAVERMDRG